MLTLFYTRSKLQKARLLRDIPCSMWTLRPATRRYRGGDEMSFDHKIFQLMTENTKQTLHIDDIFRDSAGFSTLNAEARLLFFLAAKESVPIKVAMLDSRLSYRGFYNTLNSLKKRELIRLDEDSVDKRVRNISLNKPCAAID